MKIKKIIHKQDQLIKTKENNNTFQKTNTLIKMMNIRGNLRGNRSSKLKRWCPKADKIKNNAVKTYLMMISPQSHRGRMVEV